MAAAPSPVKEVLLAIGLAVCREMVRGLNENGRYPLRKNSALAKQLLSGNAVKVSQGRSAGGRFAGYNADSKLELFALDYAQWVDKGRKPGGKKVPISALLDFIKNRNLRGRDKKTGKFIDSNRMAFILQNSIYRNGIRGRHFIQPAFDVGGTLLDIYFSNQFLDAATYELERELNFISTAA